MQEDTIAAISTPVGTGGLGIVRLSGKDALKIAQEIFRPKNKSKIVSQLKTFTTHLGYIVDDDNTVIDEVLMTIMRAPHSYTCEDVVEFSCHGGIVVLRQVLELCIKHGARIAEPGEFTKRAFLNGRIDITQAEAVCDIINSKTELQSKIYCHSLLGKTKDAVEKIINKITEILAELEVTIEYPQEIDVTTVSYENCKKNIQNIIEEISQAINLSNKITPVLTGINLAIVGKVNVGKSSLLNILLNHERAIVSDIPGTTRDTVSETINLKGYPIRIIDTAGIRLHMQDPIEQLGIQRTINAIKEADIVLLLFDAASTISVDDIKVCDIIVETLTTSGKKTIIPVVNKIDLTPVIFDDTEFKNLLNKIKSVANIYPQIDINNLDSSIPKISCKTKQGIDYLEHIILESQNLTVDKQSFTTQDVEPSLIVTNLRQKQLLENAKHELSHIFNLNFETSTELVCEHIKNALHCLNALVGKEITEEVLDIIFSRFCVGK